MAFGTCWCRSDVNNLFIHSSRKEFVGSIHDANAGVTRRIGTTASGTETGETIGRLEIISLGTFVVSPVSSTSCLIQEDELKKKNPTMVNGVCVSQVTAVCFLE